jgi:hypothetical protein
MPLDSVQGDSGLKTNSAIEWSRESSLYGKVLNTGLWLTKMPFDSAQGDSKSEIKFVLTCSQTVSLRLSLK